MPAAFLASVLLRSRARGAGFSIVIWFGKEMAAHPRSKMHALTAPPAF